MPLPPPTAPSPPSPPPSALVDVDPASIAATAARLRALALGAPPAGPPLADLLYDVTAHTPSIPGTGSGVARFFGALAAASDAQASRVRDLLGYGDAASGALGWFADSVTDTEDASASELARHGEGVPA